MDSQGLEDLIREPMGAHILHANVVKYIAKTLLGSSPPRPVNGSILAWINNKYTLHTYNTVVNK